MAYIRPLIASQPDDEQIKSIARGDRQLAMDLVVRRYGNRILQHATGILKSADEAIDICQEVFIKAMREPRFFNDDFKMKAWLFRVTSNMCFNRIRDKRRRRAILERNPPANISQASQNSDVLDGERATNILSAIESLTEQHATILKLRYYHDLSYSEIAEHLNVKLGTVMSRLSRARKCLGNALGERWKDYVDVRS